MVYENYWKFTKRIKASFDKYSLWRKISQKLKLSKQAGLRLEWFIYYKTKADRNVPLTCRHFGIAPKTFHKWKKRFDPENLLSLEDRSSAPHSTRTWEVTPIEEQRIIKLKKERIRYGKMKIAKLYETEFKEAVSSWKVQRVIERHGLLPPSRKDS